MVWAWSSPRASRPDVAESVGAGVAASGAGELLANLQRVLQHEQRLRYANTAVRGGLNRFLENWLARWPPEERTLAARLVAPLADYAVASPTARVAAVESALRLTADPPREPPEAAVAMSALTVVSPPASRSNALISPTTSTPPPPSEPVEASAAPSPSKRRIVERS